MARTVTASEVERQWGSLLESVGDEGEEVIVERDGEATAALIPIAAYEEVRSLREEKRRVNMLARFDALTEQVVARNQDLSEEEATELAVRAGREITNEMVDRLVAEGKVCFERDRR
ncbi:MAG: type II toxin-antitoxin system Phd/YefM family antitoxin [Chloroflexia bacterium]|nr:type II toxin-antitoxin system Phd/YefM family antitoxin [Chloroflexia bacterium]